MIIMLSLLIALMVIIPLVFFFILVRILSEPVIVYNGEVRRSTLKRNVMEPARWVPPESSVAYHMRLDESRVYKELVNYVNRLYFEGRISLDTREKVLKELMKKLEELDGSG